MPWKGVPSGCSESILDANLNAHRKNKCSDKGTI